MSQVDVYEAKAHLPCLLEKVERGERITITRHGRSVAVLQLVDGLNNSIGGVIDEIKRFRLGKKLQGDSIREMIEDGRD
ncbi:MAG: type II toxin-antitoxin system prevent-host-death family antitoxin [Mariprofundus sp.]|nr:type II toxin-antitoxin system prevent-host-death family antitoxin [Mariprofundus sp.]